MRLNRPPFPTDAGRNLARLALCAAASFSAACQAPEGAAFIRMRERAVQPQTDENGTWITLQARGGTHVVLRVSKGALVNPTSDCIRLPERLWSNSETLPTEIFTHDAIRVLPSAPDGGGLAEAILTATLMTAVDPSPDAASDAGATFCAQASTFVQEEEIAITTDNNRGINPRTASNHGEPAVDSGPTSAESDAGPSSDAGAGSEDAGPAEEAVTDGGLDGGGA